MKRLGKDFLAISLLLLICKYALKIDTQDYALIRYFFPKRVIHIAIAIILNYFCLKIVFDCMRDDIEMETFISIRLGRKELLKRLLKSVGLYTVSFLAVSLVLDGLLYQKSICLRFSIYAYLRASCWRYVSFRLSEAQKLYFYECTCSCCDRKMGDVCYLSFVEMMKYGDKVFEYGLKGFFVLKEGLTMVYLLK